MPKNKDCAVTDTTLCKWLNRECDDCYVKSLKTDDEKEETLKNFEVMISLLPDDFDELSGEKCQFCKKDKQKRNGYALTDLGHAEPKAMRGMFFGIGKKVRRRIGSLMPLNISICKDCRRVYRMAEGIKWMSIVGFLAAAIIIMSLPEVASGLEEIGSYMPYVVAAVSAVAGYIVGGLITMRYIKIKSKETRLNIFEIPICDKMRQDGWFMVQESPEITRFIFSKKPVMNKTTGLKEIKKTSNEDFTQTSFLED